MKFFRDKNSKIDCVFFVLSIGFSVIGDRVFDGVIIENISFEYWEEIILLIILINLIMRYWIVFEWCEFKNFYKRMCEFVSVFVNF